MTTLSPTRKEHAWPRTEFGRPQLPVHDRGAPSTVHDHINERTMEVRRYRAGQTVFRANETGDLAFIVKSGIVELFKEKGLETVAIDRLGEGAIFGEFALIDDGPRMVSARAASDDVRLIVITREMFRHKIDEADPFLRALLEVLAANVRTLVNRIG